MKGPVFFIDAHDEYEEQIVYYELREQGLGGRFILEFDVAVSLAMEFPNAGLRVEGAPSGLGLRSFRLSSFPIAIVYSVRAKTFFIVAVAHDKRKPGFWLPRLERKH